MNTDDTGTPSCLAGLLGTAAADFLRTAWGRAPLHVPRADPTSFNKLVTLEQIDEILSYSSTRPPYVRAFKAGRLVDLDEYTFSSSVARRDVVGLLDQGRLMDLFADGSTIVLDSIHHWIPEVRELCHALQKQLGGNGRATAFVSPPHQHGLDLHADSYEIFVLQIAGFKEWSLYPKLDPVPRAGAILDPADFVATQPERIVLRAGDLLYLPWGTPHSVKPLDSISAHVSIALSFPTWADVLSDLIQPLLQDQQFNRPAHPIPAQEHDLATLLKTRLDDLSEKLAAIDAHKTAAELVGRATSPKRRQTHNTLARKYAESQSEWVSPHSVDTSP